MDFAQRLAELLKKENMTAYRLSKTLGVHQTSVKNWLEGNSKPRTEHIEKIAERFGVSIDYLMGNSNVPHAGVVTNNDSKTTDNAVKDEDALAQQIEHLNKLVNYDSETTWKFLAILCRNERIEHDFTERYVAQLSNTSLQDYLNFEMDGSALLPQNIINVMKVLGIKPNRALGFLEGDLVASMKDRQKKAAFIDDYNTETGKMVKKIMLEITELDLDTLQKIAEQIKEIILRNGFDDSIKFEKAINELNSIKNRPRNKSTEADV